MVGGVGWDSLGFVAEMEVRRGRRYDGSALADLPCCPEGGCEEG
jgi:hypothetical protein